MAEQDRLYAVLESHLSRHEGLRVCRKLAVVPYTATVFASPPGSPDVGAEEGFYGTMEELPGWMANLDQISEGWLDALSLSRSAAHRGFEGTTMLTTLEMTRAEFGFYAAHIALYNGEVEPLHGHTFQVALRVTGEPDTSGMVTEFSEIKPAMRNAVASLRRRTLVPGHAPELKITQENDSLSIICGRKRYLLPTEDVTVLPLANTTLEALAGYLLSQVLPQLTKTGLVAAELAISELPGTSATARADFG